jgi:hypothetical protein
MTALFKWNARPPHRAPKVGDTRTVRKFLLLPRCIGMEWRWLGMEAIDQQAFMERSFPPTWPPMQVLKWRNIRWARAVA